jgi:hypothetical protein
VADLSGERMHSPLRRLCQRSVSASVRRWIGSASAVRRLRAGSDSRTYTCPHRNSRAAGDALARSGVVPEHSRRSGVVRPERTLCDAHGEGELRASDSSRHPPAADCRERQTGRFPCPRAVALRDRSDQRRGRRIKSVTGDSEPVSGPPPSVLRGDRTVRVDLPRLPEVQLRSGVMRNTRATE